LARHGILASGRGKFEGATCPSQTQKPRKDRFSNKVTSRGKKKLKRPTEQTKNRIRTRRGLKAAQCKEVYKHSARNRIQRKKMLMGGKRGGPLH